MNAKTNQRFPPRLRIRRHAEFARVMREGRRGGDRRLLLWVLPNGRAYTRLGLVVGRRHGNAVARNRLKRLLREAFRLSRDKLPPGFDIACAPRAGTPLDLPGARESLVRVTRRLARDAHSTRGGRP